jgi:hypothetical protein
MVLGPQGPGRVGRRQAIEKDPICRDRVFFVCGKSLIL